MIQKSFTAESADAELQGPVIITNLRNPGMVIPGRKCLFECGVEPNSHNVIQWLFNGEVMQPENYQVNYLVSSQG